MGAWGHGLLESDAALDVVGEVTSKALTDLHRLGRAGASEKNTFLACGCLGVIALFGSDYFDPRSEIVVDDSPTRASLIRAAVSVYETAMARHHPDMSPFVADILAAPRSTAPVTRHRDGKVMIQLSVDGVDEGWTRQLAKIAFAPPGARAYAQKALDALVDDINVEYLTDLAGLLHVAVTLRRWVKPPATALRAWRERCAEAEASGDDFEHALGRTCRGAVKKIAAK